MLASLHPPFLLLALAPAALALLFAYRLRSRSRRFLLAGILLPAASAAAIALALANLSLGTTPRITILLDFSPSARTSPWHDPAWVQALAQHHLPPNQPLTITAFAGTEQHTLIPDITPSAPWPAQFTWDPPSAPTDLAAALAPNPAEKPTPRWIITDGLFPPSALPPGWGGDHRTAFTILPPAAPDAAIRNLILQPASHHNLELRTQHSELSTQDSELGTELAISVQLAVTTLTHPTTARVTIQRDNTTLLDQPVDFAAPSPIPNSQFPIPSTPIVRWLTLHDPAPAPTPARYTAHIQLPSDPWPENDSASAIYPGGGPPENRTLIVGATQPANLPGTLIPADRFPTDPAQLAAEAWQTIVLNDVPAAPVPGHPALSLAAGRALDRAVRDNGTGLLLLADSRAFSPGEYGEGILAGDFLENLSPVSSYPRQSSGQTILFLLDASSSMNELAPNSLERKFALLTRALQQASVYLPADDDVSLVTFNNTATLLASGPARDLRPKLAPLLAAVQPSAGTNPDAALPLVADFLQKPGRHLIILLTDGEIPSLDIPRWRTLLAPPDVHMWINGPTSAANTISAFGNAIPGRVAAGSGGSPAHWADVLRTTILWQTRSTVQYTPLPWRADDDLSATAHQWTRTWLKPESTKFAVSSLPAATTLTAAGPAPMPDTANPPVASLAQRGLGKVAALTIADDSTQNSDVRTPNSPYQTLRQRLLAAVAAAPGDRRFSAAAQLADNGWRVTVDAIDKTTFIDNQTLTLQSLAAGATIPFTQTAPGHYEALLPSGGGSPEGLAAIITRLNSAHLSPSSSSSTGHWPLTTDHSSLIARLQTPALQTSEFPATLSSPILLPPGTIFLPPIASLPNSPPNAPSAPPWIPPASPLSLSPFFWLLATTSALAALWIRK